MKGKRILSAVLSAALLLQLSPLAAFAEDTLPLSDTATTVQTEPAPEDLAIDAQIAPEPTAETPAEPTAEPTPEASEEPTATPTPEPTAEPTATPAAEESAPDAAETPAPEPSAEPTAAPDPAAAVQALIDALPDEVTEDNAEAVEQALTDIDDAKESLTDDELAGLDLTRYDAAANALLALWGEAPTDEVELLDNYATPTKDGDWYVIDSVDDLKWLATSAPKNVKAKLTADITLNKDVLNSDGSLNTSASANFDEWKPIGTSSQPFTGTFDGGGYTIYGLYINDSSKNYVGLFGYIGKNDTATGTVKNVTLADSYVSGNEFVGGICGWNKGGTIEQSTNQSTNQATVTGREQVGGICGYNSGNITNCTAGGSVSTTGGDSVGGICGYNDGGTVENCTSGCTVEGKGTSTGGICGYNWGGLLGCRNTGTVSGGRWVGGVCGDNCSSGNGIQGCYNEGAVFGTMSVGGVCGTNSGNLKKSYNTGNVSGNSYVGGVCGTNNENLQGCYNEGAVSGSMSVGGVCGTNNGNLENSYNTNTVSGDSNVGGVCGFNNSGTVNGCYNTGDVFGAENVGGVCGWNGGGTVEKCYYLAGTSKKAVGGGIGNRTETCESKTELQFRNGDVAYQLQSDLGGATVPQVWGQRIDGTGETDDHPVLNSTSDYTVYPAATDSLCKRYSNKSDQTFNEHEYDDETGVCIRCGAWEPAEEQNGYYQITNQGQLRWFANLINTTSSSETKLNARLMNDITMDSTEWTPIGKESQPFTGTFDGDSHTITGLKCTDTSAYYVGLVGYASGAAIQNVTVQDAALNGNEYIGAVCGYITGGTITNCHVVNTAIGGNTEGKYYGGIVGCIIGNTNVTGCTNSGSTVNGGYRLGGIAGQVDHATVQRCFNTGIVTGSNSEIGGIAGIEIYATVLDCGNSGAVTKTDNSGNCGGIVGNVYGGSIQNCYNAVSNMAYPIFVTHAEEPILSNCYYLPGDTGSSGSTDQGITAKTQAQFASGEVAYLLQKEHGDTAVWGQTIGKDKYPKLGGDKVYQSAPCTADYSNTEIPPKQHVIGNDGKCTNCGAQCIAYTVTIPATVELGNKATIKAKDVILPNGKTLNVKVAEGSEFKVAQVDDNDAVVDKCAYTVTKGETKTPVNPSDTVLTAVNGESEKTVELQFNKPETTTYSGEYKGTVKFTVSVDDKPAS